MDPATATGPPLDSDYFWTTEDYGTDDYGTDDYGTGSPDGGGMCGRGWVRDFRAQYEPPLFWIIFLLGAVGNLLVVLIYCTFRRRIKTMTDIYLLNLAVADLLFLCTLPFWAQDALNGWSFGRGACKVVLPVYKINFFSSVLLLTCISVDRYVAIVQVAKAHNSKKKRLFYSKVACLAVWLASVLLALPEFMFATVRTGEKKSCALVYGDNSKNRTKILVLALQICVGFCLPLIIMFFCYSVIIRKLLQAKNFEKHKALRVIFAVVLVFVLSQLPYNAFLVMEATQAANVSITDCETVKRFDVAGKVAKSLAYTHACLNPFLYVFIGVRFRQDLMKMVKMRAGSLSKAGLMVSPSSSKRQPSVMSETETTPALSL
ncbi:unnamed protein product [Knipowitschia caucasica]|uniref:G-protein coupled receptors family 1 profile domain-containing protein n=1 Tax=Knipowitschia caucasica TaxID=637954 RepID=A0AAV2L7K4_KNICA